MTQIVRRGIIADVLLLLVSLLPGTLHAAPLTFTVNMSEAVTVSTTGGTPRIALDIGGVTKYATYAGGSGTSSLTFSYAVQAGDFDANGIASLSPIELNGGMIADAAGNPANLTFVPPDMSGVRIQTYRPVWTTDPITAANAAAAAFEITKAPLDANFAWEVTSDGGGSASGSGTISAAPHPVAGIDLSSLGNGTLTLSLTLTTAAGTSAPRTVTATKSVDWCTDPAALGAASPGAVCGDGSLYAGSLSGTYLITHVSGCGYEPGGTNSTKAGASFTPSCSGGTDSTLKSWANSMGANEGATSLTDGLANTNQLLADAQRENAAAAYCYHMDLNGQTDWYLPSRDELNVLYTNRTAIGGYAASNYWASSEGESRFGWQQAGDGSQGYAGKQDPLRVRCVRRAN